MRCHVGPPVWAVLHACHPNASNAISNDQILVDEIYHALHVREPIDIDCPVQLHQYDCLDAGGKHFITESNRVQLTCHCRQISRQLIISAVDLVSRPVSAANWKIRETTSGDNERTSELTMRGMGKRWRFFDPGCILASFIDYMEKPDR
jgi:hypothetical protein